MRVVSDSSPLHYLVLADLATILPNLFGCVDIPQAVSDELQHSAAPAKVRELPANPPEWLCIRPVGSEANLEGPETLGAGERAAIALAKSCGPDSLLLIDDSKGRKTAESFGIRILGTLGVLDLAAARGLLDLPSAIDRLRQTNFYPAPSILKALQDADSERRKSRG